MSRRHRQRPKALAGRLWADITHRTRDRRDDRTHVLDGDEDHQSILSGRPGYCLSVCHAASQSFSRVGVSANTSRVWSCSRSMTRM